MSLNSGEKSVIVRWHNQDWSLQGIADRLQKPVSEIRAFLETKAGAGYPGKIKISRSNNERQQRSEQRRSPAGFRVREHSPKTPEPAAEAEEPGGEPEEATESGKTKKVTLPKLKWMDEALS